MIRELIRKGDDIGDSLPRQFVAPSVNFDATSLQTLIDWDNVQLSEPLLTATMSTEEVIACLDSPLQVPRSWQWPGNGEGSQEGLRDLLDGGGREEDGGLDQVCR